MRASTKKWNQKVWSAKKTSPGTPAKQPKMPIRIHPAVANRRAEKMDEPGNHIAVEFRRRCRHDAIDLSCKLRRQPLIGVEMQFPAMFQRQVLDRPVALRIIAF